MTESLKLYKFLDDFFAKVDNKKDEYLFTDYLEFTVLNEHIRISIRSDMEMNAASLDKENGTMSLQTLAELRSLVQGYFTNKNSIYENYFL